MRCWLFEDGEHHKVLDLLTQVNMFRYRNGLSAGLHTPRQCGQTTTQVDAPSPSLAASNKRQVHISRCRNSKDASMQPPQLLGLKKKPQFPSTFRYPVSTLQCPMHAHPPPLTSSFHPRRTTPQTLAEPWAWTRRPSSSCPFRPSPLSSSSGCPRACAACP